MRDHAQPRRILKASSRVNQVARALYYAHIDTA
jgi:hypothetical protein